jgi:hypothetical protein
MNDHLAADPMVVPSKPRRGGPLSMYVIYERPLDYPDHYVVRRWAVFLGDLSPDAAPHAVTLTLEAARASIPHGMVALPRNADDEPQIVESWI